MNTKRNTGDYWFSCNDWADESDNANLTFPKQQMNRVTAFTWDLNGEFANDAYLAKVEITYYVMFKKRKWALQ